MVTGLDLNRCQILFAAIEKHVGINLENRDVFVSVAGGMQIKDPAVDLAVCAAVISSAKDTVIKAESVFAGEVGILGQLAKIALPDVRLKEAERLGFKEAFIPAFMSAGFKTKALKTVPLEEISGLISSIGIKNRQ